MKTMIYTRKGQRITDHKGISPITTEYASISLAKRASFKLQMGSDGGLGRGTLRLAP